MVRTPSDNFAKMRPAIGGGAAMIPPSIASVTPEWMQQYTSITMCFFSRLKSAKASADKLSKSRCSLHCCRIQRHFSLKRTIFRYVRHRQREIYWQILQLQRAKSSYRNKNYISTSTKRSLLSSVRRHRRRDVCYFQKQHLRKLQRSQYVLRAIQKTLLCYVRALKYARVRILTDPKWP